MTWEQFVAQRDAGALALWMCSMALALLAASVPRRWRVYAVWLWVGVVILSACR